MMPALSATLYFFLFRKAEEKPDIITNVIMLLRIFIYPGLRRSTLKLESFLKHERYAIIGGDTTRDGILQEECLCAHCCRISKMRKNRL